MHDRMPKDLGILQVRELIFSCCPVFEKKNALPIENSPIRVLVELFPWCTSFLLAGHSFDAFFVTENVILPHTDCDSSLF